MGLVLSLAFSGMAFASVTFTGVALASISLAGISFAGLNLAAAFMPGTAGVVAFYHYHGGVAAFAIASVLGVPRVSGARVMRVVWVLVPSLVQAVVLAGSGFALGHHHYFSVFVCLFAGYVA